MAALAHRRGDSMVARSATESRPAAVLSSEPLPPVEPLSPEVQELVDEQGIDMSISGLEYLNNETRVRASGINRL